MPAHTSSTRPDFQLTSMSIPPARVANARGLSNELSTNALQCDRTESYPIHVIAANGTNDFRAVLKAAGENICCSFTAGLMRSNFGESASGANTNPPCASPTANDTAKAQTKTGRTQRKTSMLVKKRIGP